MKKFLAITLVVLISLTTVSAIAATNNLTYYLKSENLTGWETNETKALDPGYVCIGDVIVNSTKRHDDGDGEDTVVINMSKKPAMVFAPYGGQLQQFLTTTKLDTLVSQLALQEFSRIDELKGVYKFHTIRFVIVADTVEDREFFVKRTEFFK